MAVEELLKSINKKAGYDAIRVASTVPNVSKVLTQIPAVDFASDGGLPIKRIIEFFGGYSSCKSYTMYRSIREFQNYCFKNMSQFMEEPELTKKVALIDIEGTYTPEWGEKMGIDNDQLIYLCPDSLSQAVDVAIALLSDDEVSLVCMDGIASVGADAESDASMEDNQMGVNARFWNRAFRNLQVAINRSEHGTLLVLNSSYDSIGVSFGNPEKLKSGNQLKLSKALSLKFDGLTPIKKKIDGKDVLAGRNIKVENKKNKTGIPFKASKFYFSYIDDAYMKANTTDVEDQVVELALELGYIERKGAFYNYDGGKKIQGFENFMQYLVVDNPELYEDVRDKVMATIIK